MLIECEPGIECEQPGIECEQLQRFAVSLGRQGVIIWRVYKLLYTWSDFA